MVDQEQVTIRQVPWFDGVGELINQSAKTDKAGLDYIRQAVERMELLIYEFREGDGLLGIITARVDITYKGDKQLILIHVVSAKENMEPPFLVITNPFIEAMARRAGIGRVIVYSDRPGMDRRFETIGGFRLLEKVYFKDVT